RPRMGYDRLAHHDDRNSGTDGLGEVQPVFDSVPGDVRAVGGNENMLIHPQPLSSVCSTRRNRPRDADRDYPRDVPLRSACAPPPVSTPEAEWPEARMPETPDPLLRRSPFAPIFPPSSRFFTGRG